MKQYFYILTLVLVANCTSRSEKTNSNFVKKEVNSKIMASNIFECLFKNNLNKPCWTRVGVYPIDSISENYACNLISDNIKEILLAKYIGDNGAFPNETAYVLWYESGTGYLKEFYTDGTENVFGKEKQKTNWHSLKMIADSINIFTVDTKPKLSIEISHDIGFAVQYMSSEMFFCDRLQDNEWKSATDKNHPKVIFWNSLNNLLKPPIAR